MCKHTPQVVFPFLTGPILLELGSSPPGCHLGLSSEQCSLCFLALDLFSSYFFFFSFMEDTLK